MAEKLYADIVVWCVPIVTPKNLRIAKDYWE